MQYGKHCALLYIASKSERDNAALGYIIWYSLRDAQPYRSESKQLVCPLRTCSLKIKPSDIV